MPDEPQNLLEMVEEEQIRRFARMVCPDDREVLDRIDREIGTGPNLLSTLEPPEGGEEEFADVFRRTVLPAEIDSQHFSEVQQAIARFLAKMESEAMSLSVFECLFALLKYGINKVTHWDARLVDAWKTLIKQIAHYSDAQMWETDEVTVCVNWKGDMNFIQFDFPPV